jgi:hypothetical protein
MDSLSHTGACPFCDERADHDPWTHVFSETDFFVMTERGRCDRCGQPWERTTDKMLRELFDPMPAPGEHLTFEVETWRCDACVQIVGEPHTGNEDCACDTCLAVDLADADDDELAG